MKFVALLSGGKDSCFNITHCQINGHELVAAASLRPREGIDELDSYLYQTVGQDAIEFVAQALGVPLHRRVITGTAVQMENEYGTRKGVSESTDQAVDGDETEDMFQLLKDVLERHPEVQAVSVGAILSSYQRIRVEHVCRRLGLTSLSYLWQRDQGELLQEMVDSGVNAVLIKVAGIGLKPQHLGLSLAQMQPILQQLNARFGSHICGEGGEYESLTLDCPAFTKRILITESETVIHEDKGFATVAYWRIKSADIQEKLDSEQPLLSLTMPPLLDGISKPIYEAALAVDNEAKLSTPSEFRPTGALSASISRRGRWISIGSVYGTHKDSLTIEEETKLCFENLKALLSQQGSDFTAIVHINALLSSMDTFIAFNRVYSQMFGTSPPARACVAVCLPSPHRVALECIAYVCASPSERFALHVQGVSYWAPANIGPYSQAIGIDGFFHVSGQIGLVPSSMVLPAPLDVPKEAALSLQHVRRIAQVLPLTSSADDCPLYLGLIVWFTLKETLPALATSIRLAMEANSSKSTSDIDRPPVLFVVPVDLPKGAAVEIQTIFQAVHTPDEESPSLTSIINMKGDANVRRESCQLNNGRVFDILWLNKCAFGDALKYLHESSATFKPLSSRVYCRIEPPQQLIDDLRHESAVTVIPVRGVFCMPTLERSVPVSWDLAIVSLVLES